MGEDSQEVEAVVNNKFPGKKEVNTMIDMTAVTTSTDWVSVSSSKHQPKSSQQQSLMTTIEETHYKEISYSQCPHNNYSG